MTTDQLTPHPIANEFPEFEREDYEALKADIQANGQKIPIELYKGQILDGRNRYRACIELGLEPQLRAYDGADPLGHAISLNLIRRQLSTVDKALLARLIQPKFTAAAAERKAATLVPTKAGEKVGSAAHKERATDKAPVPGRDNQALTPNLLDIHTGQARDQAAKAVGVSGRTVENVAFLQKNAPEVLADVKAELLTISQGVDKVRRLEASKHAEEAKAIQAAKRAQPPADSDSDSDSIVIEEGNGEPEASAPLLSTTDQWNNLNRMLDVFYNARLITPGDAARITPENAKKRVRAILAYTSSWANAYLTLLDNGDLTNA